MSSLIWDYFVWTYSNFFVQVWVIWFWPFKSLNKFKYLEVVLKLWQAVNVLMKCPFNIRVCTIFRDRNTSEILTGNPLKYKTDNSILIVSIYMGYYPSEWKEWMFHHFVVILSLFYYHVHYQARHLCLCLTLKAPITTAADDKFSDIFRNFRNK